MVIEGVLVFSWVLSVFQYPVLSSSHIWLQLSLLLKLAMFHLGTPVQHHNTHGEKISLYELKLFCSCEDPGQEKWETRCCTPDHVETREDPNLGCLGRTPSSRNKRTQTLALPDMASSPLIKISGVEFLLCLLEGLMWVAFVWCFVFFSNGPQFVA